MIEKTNLNLDTFFKETKEHKVLQLEELLELFKKYAPHALTQNEARLTFKELSNYLTPDEEHKLFVSWEKIHYENKADEFYGTIHELREKYL